MAEDVEVGSVGEGPASRAAQLLAGPRGREVCARVALARTGDPNLPQDQTQMAAFVARLRSVESGALSALGDRLALVAPLARSVDSAMYWQEPHEENQILDTPPVVSALEPVARALALAPAARWWWSPADLEQQAITYWVNEGQAVLAEFTGARERLERWRSATIAEEEQAAQDRPVALDANCSGSWWSTPLLANSITTSRRIDGLPAAQLELVEDSLGWTRARVAAARVRPDRRVFEIAGPTDWVELVERYPLDVDRSRRHDWRRATGGTGPWQIPDWSAVSRDYDGVHLTVIGYLGTAGRALATQGGQTVLAGFDPDLTYWLTDSIIETTAANMWRMRGGNDLGRQWIPDPSP